jgi:hypothetical protein
MEFMVIPVLLSNNRFKTRPADHRSDRQITNT